MRPDSTQRPTLVSLLLVVTVLTAAFLIGGCGPYLLPVAPSDQPAATTPPTPVAPVIVDPGQQTVDQLWQTSAHGNSFVSSAEGNNICAQCHAPWNYIPISSAELPKDCLSCKFTLPTPDPVEADDWASIPCDICHRVADGAAEPGVYWVHAIIIDFSDEDPYEAMGTNTELCEKCHRDAGEFSYARDMGSQLHQSQQCTDCHDSHGLTADCTSCHADALNQKELAHDPEGHEEVSCVACHDASGLDVKPNADGIWQPVRTTERYGETPYVSHDLQLAVDCGRCHYTGNAWGLRVK